MPAAYWPRTELMTASSGSGIMTARSSLTFSSRIPWASTVAGGSISVSASTCMTWFWTMSRSAPAVS